MPNNPFELYDKPVRSRGKARRHPSHFFSDAIDEFSVSSEEARATNPKQSLLRPGERVSLNMLLCIPIIVLVVLLGRSFWLQVIAENNYRGLAEGNRIHEIIQKAPRGVIYDRGGAVLAKNNPQFVLLLTEKTIPRPNKEAYQQSLQDIATATNHSLQDIETLAKESNKNAQPVIVQDAIPYEDALKMIVSLKDVQGLTVESSFHREYPAGDWFSHLLGYTSKMNREEYLVKKEEGYRLNDEIGKTGIEKTHETNLHGTDGVTRVEVNRVGRAQRVLNQDQAKAGNNLILSIDGNLQKLIYEKLKKTVDERGVPGASAVAINPQNGEVLAMVSYPSFDNNQFSGGIPQDEYKTLLENPQKPLFNRPVSGEYPSGSTFKLVVAAAALEERVISPTTTVSSTGGLKIDTYFFPDWKAGGHGVTDVHKALADSVNTFFYLAGGGDNQTNTGLGVERIVAYARKFGLAKKTGIDLPGEADGFLPSKAWKEEKKNEPWYIGDTYHLAIGQGDLLVTPLQVAAYTAIVANGGKQYQPHLVHAVVHSLSGEKKTVEPVLENERVTSPESIQIVREGMRQTVTNGSARSLNTTVPVPSAAKTGTAQFGVKNKTHAWFTAFAPYDNPTIAITILVEEGGGSNDTAVPIGREVLAEYFKNPQNFANLSE